MNRIHTNEHRSIAAVVALGLCLATIAGTALAQEQNGGAPGDWLSNYSSARSIGIGGAFVAVADEPLAALWNPSCLAQTFQNKVHLETALLFEETGINVLSFATPERRILPGFGFTIISLRSGEFQRTNELNDDLGTFRDGETAYLVSFSKSVMPRLAVGANVKIVRQSIAEFQASAAGADFGVLANVLPSVAVGVSLLNIGGPSLTLRETAEEYPMEVRGGAAFRFLSGKALLTAEVDHRDGYDTRFHAGSEFWVHPLMGLRVGYDDSYVSGGISFAINPAMRLDYGMADQILGVTHRFGLSYQFGGFFARSEAVPPVFSPLGTQSVTKFNLTARTKTEATRWDLSIVDKSNQIVRRFSGKGTPPPHVMWDGKDENGLSLADGVYRFQLVVVDAEGRTTAGQERKVEITTSGPQGEVPVIISNTDHSAGGGE
jgi:hypothetical protein